MKKKMKGGMDNGDEYDSWLVDPMAQPSNAAAAAAADEDYNMLDEDYNNLLDYNVDDDKPFFNSLTHNEDNPLTFGLELEFKGKFIKTPPKEECFTINDGPRINRYGGVVCKEAGGTMEYKTYPALASVDIVMSYGKKFMEEFTILHIEAQRSGTGKSTTTLNLTSASNDSTVTNTPFVRDDTYPDLLFAPQITIGIKTDLSQDFSLSFYMQCCANLYQFVSYISLDILPAKHHHLLADHKFYLGHHIKAIILLSSIYIFLRYIRASEQISIFIGQIFYCSYILINLRSKKKNTLSKYKFIINPKSIPEGITFDECKTFLDKIKITPMADIYSVWTIPQPLVSRFQTLVGNKACHITEEQFKKIIGAENIPTAEKCLISLFGRGDVHIFSGSFDNIITHRCLVEVRAPHFLTKPKEEYFLSGRIKIFQSNVDNIGTLLDDVQKHFLGEL